MPKKTIYVAVLCCFSLVFSVFVICCGQSQSDNETDKPNATPIPRTTPVIVTDISIDLLVFEDSYKNLSLAGMLRNTGSQSYCGIDVYYDVFGIDGNVLETGSLFIENRTVMDRNHGELSNSCLTPGDIGSAKNYWLESSLADVLRVETKITANKSIIDTPDPDLRVANVTFSQSADQYEITGDLENIGPKAATNVSLDALLFDRFNQFLGFADYLFLESDDLCTSADSHSTMGDCLAPGSLYGFRSASWPHPDIGAISSVAILPTWSSEELVYFPPKYEATITLRATSGEDGGETSMSRDGTVFLAGAGYGGCCRGLNIAVMDQHTGVTQSLKNFDTWGDYSADDKLIDFIGTIPAGSIVIMTAADEASNQLSSLTRDVIRRDLGSQLIGGIQYWDSWAMITTKGQPVSIAEDLGKYDKTTQHYVGVAVEASITLK